jgi:dipeptidyl aminopeptidase/acylaminoacyl peptidase
VSSGKADATSRVSTSRRQFLLCAAAGLGAVAGCRRTQPGQQDLPPGVVRQPGVFQDIAPQWSHDGSKIAFLRRTTDRRYQLCLTSPDLSQPHPLLEPELINPDRAFSSGRAAWRAPERLEWSPDDSRIVFSRTEWFTFDDGQRLPGTGLWVYDLLTKAAKPLAIHPKDYEGSFYYFRSPRWSPDGRRVAFVGEGINGETALFIRELAAESPEMGRPRFDQYEDVDWPAWSPDGRLLGFRQGILRAFTADPVETIRVISPGGTEARRLFTADRGHYARMAAGSTAPDALASTPRTTGPSWSPDAHSLLFALAPHPLVPDSYSVWRTGALNAGTDAIRLSPSDGYGYLSPAWVDRERVVAVRTVAMGWEAVLLGQGSNPRVLCRLPFDDFAWSPDRSRIVCAVPTNGRPSAPTTLRVFETRL